MLVDLQNRQPDAAHVAGWIGDTGEAWIFYDDREIGLLAPYFEIGPQVSIVPLSRPGSNSLDFHLIMYLGYLIAKRKQASRFIVVADDRDYDPAIEHARSEGIDVVRVANLPAAPDPAPATKTKPVARAVEEGISQAPAIPEQRRKSQKARTSIAVYAGILRDIKLNRPSDLQALQSRIRSRLGQDSSDRVGQILEHLVTMDVISLDGETLRYLD